MWADLQKGVFHTHPVPWTWRTVTLSSKHIQSWKFTHLLTSVGTQYWPNFKAIAVFNAMLWIFKLDKLEDAFSQIPIWPHYICHRHFAFVHEAPPCIQELHIYGMKHILLKMYAYLTENGTFWCIYKFIIYQVLCITLQQLAWHTNSFYGDYCIEQDLIIVTTSTLVGISLTLPFSRY